MLLHSLKMDKFWAIHSWQEDSGFRAAKSRNKAITKTTGDYIILVDGDIILHPKFIEDHINNAESGYFVQGSRVLLTQNRTKIVLNDSGMNFSFTSDRKSTRLNSSHVVISYAVFCLKKKKTKKKKYTTYYSYTHIQPLHTVHACTVT